MTVASLWKLLDEAGCGVLVGAQDILDPEHAKRSTNPWNFNQQQRVSLPENRPTLAIDLSIWICEGLTSHAMGSNNTNPALHLTYTRTIKLLSMGIKLVAVIEGKRRVRRTEETDTFHRRRSGTAFWKACKACEQMFEHLGVPVAKAKAEGEALCALLNTRGIVDGVISNDGDCLLFGAKVVYTKFSIENLQSGNVKRYEASNLKALVEKETGERRAVLADNKISLSRHDLVAFALLTGSDLAGNGFPKVGYKKAVRFIFKCKHDRPLSIETAAMEELQLWSKTAKVIATFQNEEIPLDKDCEKHRCCSHCGHAGDKRSHLKNGCEECGTGPGEPCFELTSSDRFRKSLREKALSLVPPFAPVMVIEAYLRPNDNQIPLRLEGSTSASLHMRLPSIKGLLGSNLIIKGQSHAGNREFLTESLSRLLIKQHLFNGEKVLSDKSGRRGLSKELPVPFEITRRLVKDKQKCYEITWKVYGTVTDSEGNDADGYEFSTAETQELIKKRYPDLVEKFLENEAAIEKQGDAERTKRKDFIENLLRLHQQQDNEKLEDIDDGKCGGRVGIKRKRVHETFFQEVRGKLCSDDRQPIQIGESDEVKALMNRFIGKKKYRGIEDFDFSTIASGSLVFHVGEPAPKKAKKEYGRRKPPVMSFPKIPLGMTITVFKPGTKPVESESTTTASSSPSNCCKAANKVVRPDQHGSDMGVPTEKSTSNTSRQGDPDSNPATNKGCVPSLIESLGSKNADDNENRVPKVVQIDEGVPSLIESLGSKSDDDKENQEPHSQAKTKVAPHLSVNGAPLRASHDHASCDRRESTVTPVVRPNEHGFYDPEAWMANVVVYCGSATRDQGDATTPSSQAVNRKLDFGSLTDAPKGNEVGKMPPLAQGLRRHLIVCDMGIPVEVSPVKRRRRHTRVMF